ncbi:unnamed protein product [Lampetra fluviatilis]
MVQPAARVHMNTAAAARHASPSTASPPHTAAGRLIVGDHGKDRRPPPPSPNSSDWMHLPHESGTRRHSCVSSSHQHRTPDKRHGTPKSPRPPPAAAVAYPLLADGSVTSSRCWRRDDPDGIRYWQRVVHTKLAFVVKPPRHRHNLLLHHRRYDGKGSSADDDNKNDDGGVRDPRPGNDHAPSPWAGPSPFNLRRPPWVQRMSAGSFREARKKRRQRRQEERRQEERREPRGTGCERGLRPDSHIWRGAARESGRRGEASAEKDGERWRGRGERGGRAAGREGERARSGEEGGRERERGERSRRRVRVGGRRAHASVTTKLRLRNTSPPTSPLLRLQQNLSV